jgi:hypothetical protein
LVFSENFGEVFKAPKRKKKNILITTLLNGKGIEETGFYPVFSMPKYGKF